MTTWIWIDPSKATAQSIEDGGSDNGLFAPGMAPAAAVGEEVADSVDAAVANVTGGAIGTAVIGATWLVGFIGALFF